MFRPACLLLAVAAAASSATAAPPAKPRQLSSVEGITEYVLPNGLRVLLFPDQSKETFTINITYLVGSRHEGYGETGMAHLLEHMLFKGSPKHPKVWEELKQRGASNNATTWYDRTNYFETLPAKGDNLAWAIELEADRMVNSNIAQSELSKEFSVVRNEFEIGENNPAGILSERMWSTAYLWHNYGKSTIGSRADIEKVPAPTLKKFYKKYYRPDNAVLLITGKFDTNQALDLIGKHFGVLQNPAEKLAKTYTVEPVQDGERVVTLRRTGDVQVVGLVYHTVAAADADFPATLAIADIMTSEPSGRLYTALVKTGLASSVSAYTLPLHDPGAIEITATVPMGKSVDVVRDKMIQIVEGFAKSKITDEEVARFRAKSKKQFKHAFANSAQLGIAISEYIAAGDWRLMFVNRDRTAKLQPADVQKAAQQFLISSNRTLGTFVPTKAPERAPLKEQPEVTALVKEYKGQAAETDGEKFDATLDNIEKRTKRYTLASGMKLAVLDKKTRGHVVRARLTLRYGTEADFTGKRLAASAIDDLLARGSKKYTFQQLKDKWDALEAQVNFASTPGLLDVNITTTRDNLQEVLEIVDDILRNPTMPADQFEIVKKEVLTALDEQKSDPQTQAFLTMQRAISPYTKNHPLYVASTDELIADVKRLQLGQLKAWPRMFGTSNATMTIVGDVDVAAIKPWIEKGWGSWKSPRPFKRIERKFKATTTAEQVLDFPDKANALIAAAHTVEMKDDDADAPAVAVANYVLGGGGFVSRLLTRLRQKDGLSYFAFSGMQLYPFDAAGAFFAGGAMNPENAKKGMAAMLEEINLFVSKGITADELKGAKDGILQGFDRNLSNDAAVMSMIHDGQYLERKMDYYAKHNAALKSLSLETVNSVIKKRFKPDSLVKITAGDKKKMP